MNESKHACPYCSEITVIEHRDPEYGRTVPVVMQSCEHFIGLDRDEIYWDSAGQEREVKDENAP